MSFIDISFYISRLGYISERNILVIYSEFCLFFWNLLIFYLFIIGLLRYFGMVNTVRGRQRDMQFWIYMGKKYFGNL